MPDVFISYSAKDEPFAKIVHDHLRINDLNVFMASISLQQGERWTPQIIEALRNSDWVFLLATQNALASPNVQQEIGGAVFGKKRLVPIMWDIQPEQLPTWVSQFQGLALSGATIEDINLRIAQLAAKVKADKNKGQLVVGAVLLALLMLAR